MRGAVRSGRQPGAWSYLRERKRYWLLPLVLAIGILALLSWLSAGPESGPFIYTVY